MATLGSTDILSIPATTAYTGNPIETLPAISVDPSKTNGIELTSSDYTASWITTSPVNVGTYGIKVTANTNSTHFKGENTHPTFSITKRDLSTVDIELTGISSFDSKNPAKAPTISKITDKTSKETLNLVKDTDYTVTYTLILDNGDEKAPDALDGAIPKKGKITITATGDNCLPTSTTSKEFTFTNANDNSSVSSSTSNSSTSSSNSTSSSSSSSNSSSNTIGSSITTGSTNSKPTLTLPTNVISVESDGPLKSAEVKKLEDYIKSNHNEYGYDLKVNSASVATNKNGQSTFTMSITAQLENDSKIDITLSNLKKRRSEDAMIEENEFVEFIDLEEEMEDSSLDYVTVDDSGKDGKKVTIKGIKASDAFRVNNYLNGTKIRNILSDHGYKVSDLNFSSAAKMNYEFSITDLSKPISIVASATPQSSSTTTTPSKPVGGNGIIQLPSSPAQPTTPTVVKKPTYRFFNTLTGKHFYTSSEAERDELMKDSRWNNEGQGWTSPAISKFVVYRLCNPNTGEHHYTTDKNEYDTLPAYGWVQEGIGFYSADPQVSDIAVVYRLFNPKANNAGSHHYTLSEQERNNLVNNGWRDEGIAWYGIR